MFDQIKGAILALRAVHFSHNGRRRVAHPHLLGEGPRGLALLYWQAGGSSKSNDLPGWRWAYLSDVSDVDTREENFAPRLDFNRLDDRFRRVDVSV